MTFSVRLEMRNYAVNVIVKFLTTWGQSDADCQLAKACHNKMLPYLSDVNN